MKAAPKSKLSAFDGDVQDNTKKPEEKKGGSHDDMIEFTGANILAYLQASQRQMLSESEKREVPVTFSVWGQKWRMAGSTLRQMSRNFKSGEFTDGSVVVRVSTSGKLPSLSARKSSLRLVAGIMNQAVQDCRVLDFCREGHQLAPVYLKRLNFSQTKAFISLYCLINKRRRELNATRQPKSGSTNGKCLLKLIEQLISDGVGADVALSLLSISNGEGLLQQGRDGNIGHFIALGCDRSLM